MKDRELILGIKQLIEKSPLIKALRGPYNTLYWNKSVGDNCLQQQMGLTDKDSVEYEIIIREKKVK